MSPEGTPPAVTGDVPFSSSFALTRYRQEGYTFKPPGCLADCVPGFPRTSSRSWSALVGRRAVSGRVRLGRGPTLRSSRKARLVPEQLHVEVVPWGPNPQAVAPVLEIALGDPAVRAALGEAEHRVLSSAPVISEDPDEEPTRLRATVYDYTNERTLLIDAQADGSPGVEVSSSARQPLPSGEERAAALALLEQDAELGPALREGRLTPYRPMPPLVLEELPDGRVERTLAVGLRPQGNGTTHEIVGVRLARGEVVRFDGGAPDASLADETLCGLTDAGQPTVQGVPGAARITVRRGADVLWTLVAVRPAASSGTNGSGIELRSVSYRGKRVLRRAHVPILNVRYEGDACGPFRDWQNEEGTLTATGTDVAPGFRLCPTPARTILETGSDHGNFTGVAIHVEGEELVLTCELQAGWYRYISQWRLHADGTIRPRFGFGAVEDSCVCSVHHHHVYWRFDFDVAGFANNAVREFNDPPVTGTAKWHTLRHEVRRPRSTTRKRRWRVVNRDTHESYTLVPGPGDGVADSFGVGDMWALRRRGRQLDDGQGFTTDPAEARAHLNRFVNGESIYGADVVMWYAAHFSHDVHEEVGHVVGPELVPAGW